MAAGPGHRSGRPFLVALGGLLALAAAMGIGRFVYTPILPFMISGIGVSPSHAGLIASANFSGYLVGALIASIGGLPGRVRVWFIAALAGSAVTTAAMGLTEATVAFVLLRFAGGATSAFAMVFSATLILDRLSAAGRSGLSAVHFAGVGAGIAASAVLVAVLADLGSDWRLLWLASGVLTVICLAAAVMLVAPRREAAPNAQAGAVQKPPGGLPALIVAYGLFGFGYVITATFISVMVVEKPALAPAEPYVWLVFGLAAAPSVLIWTLLARRYGGIVAFAIACGVEAVGVVLSVAAESPAMALVASALVGGTFMGITALGLVEARCRAPERARRIIALMTASFGLGQMVGPWLAGLLREGTGSFATPSYLAAGALVLAAAIVLAGALPRHARPL
ncbi:MAG: YbfB/YjiJ family MFS transporter [Pseudomonadota bacterium]